MKVLITGGAGFIGYHLAKRYLCHPEKPKIVLVDNFQRGVMDSDLVDLVGHEQVEFVKADLLSPADLAKLPADATHIFHLAAIIGVRHVMERPFSVLAENAVLLMNVIEHGRKCASLKRIVFASTSEVYAGCLLAGNLAFPTPETQVLSLSPLSEARTTYSLSKIYGEALCLHSGLPVTIVRPHNFYGPRMGLSHVIPELLKKAHSSKGEPIEVLSPTHTRTFCYIDDAVETMLRLSEDPRAQGDVFNVGASQPEIAMLELARLVIDVVRGPTCDAVGGTFSPGSPARRCPDISRASRVLGHSNPVSLEDGVRRTYEWYRAKVFASESSKSAL